MKYRNYLMTAFTTGNSLCNMNQIEEEIIKSEIKPSFHYSVSENFNLPDGYITFYFRDDLDSFDINVLDLLVSNHNPRKEKIKETSFDDYSNIMVSSVPKTFQKVNFISHNFCDKSTWIEKAIRVNDITMLRISDNLYELPTPEKLINVRWGKLSDEDWWINYYKNINSPSLDLTVKVLVDNVEKIETTLENPYGDYSINYDSGSIYFNNPINLNSVVKMSYAKPTTCELSIYPNENSVLFIESCEAQFSCDTNVKDTVMFEIWGEKGKDPRLDNIPVPIGTKIKMGWKEYKTLLDYVNESDRGYRIFKCDNPQERDLNCDGYVYAWDYKSSIELNAQYGNFLKIVLKNNIEFLGSYCTATLYCSSRKL